MSFKAFVSVSNTNWPVAGREREREREGEKEKENKLVNGFNVLSTAHGYLRTS